jgi:hypothetical protein
MDETKGFSQDLMIQIVGDPRLNPTHVALLFALLCYKGGKFPVEFFNASRNKLMSVSHIRNIVSYHKYIAQLVQFGYIEYSPTWHPVNGSQFRFLVKGSIESHRSV